MKTMAAALTDVKEILARLVGFDTTSHKSNIELVDYVEHLLRHNGVTSERVVNEDGTKASLFASIGPSGMSGIALSGHTDVVPVEGQVWSSDPFALRQDGERLFGRGTTDMKGFLACCLAAVPDFQNRNLKTPIQLAFSYDEETGCTGVRPMLAAFGETLIRPKLAIVGEPSRMTVVDAHKGPVRWQVKVTGRAAHSSMAPLGVNAVTAAAQVIAELGRIETELRATSQNERFDPPYSTLQVTMIDGGTAANIVPDTCHLVFDVRAIEGLDVNAIETRLQSFCEDELLPPMQAIAPETAIEIIRTNEVPPYSATEGSPAVALALHLAEQNETFAVSYATEAGLFQTSGVPAVICGPGDIAQAHTADEWIAESELAKCRAFMTRLADWAEQNK